MSIVNYMLRDGERRELGVPTRTSDTLISAVGDSASCVPHEAPSGAVCSIGIESMQNASDRATPPAGRPAQGAA